METTHLVLPHLNIFHFWSAVIPLADPNSPGLPWEGHLVQPIKAYKLVRLSILSQYMVLMRSEQGEMGAGERGKRGEKERKEGHGPSPIIVPPSAYVHIAQLRRTEGKIELCSPTFTRYLVGQRWLSPPPYCLLLIRCSISEIPHQLFDSSWNSPSYKAFSPIISICGERSKVEVGRF